MIGGCPQLEGLPGNGDGWNPLVGFQPIRMSESKRSVPDHLAGVIGGVSSLSSRASVRNMACDHSRGVATGPQRSIHF